MSSSRVPFLRMAARRRGAASWVPPALTLASVLLLSACVVEAPTTGRPCSNGKCPSGLVCVSGSCVASATDGGTASDGGTSADGGSACDPSACTAPAHGTATCSAGACAFTCDTGYHACGSACADDTSPDTCGTACTPCSPPAHAAATCSAGACGFACSTGYHACGSACADDTAPATCGTACTPCPTPTHATATCDGTACGIQCSAGYHDCGGACVPDDSTSACGASCTACTAPPNATVACVGGACQITCPQGQTACGSQCVDLQTDAANCGACGHDCMGSACQAGICEPVVLAQGEFDPIRIAVDDANVYWCSSSGGNPRGSDYIRTVQKNGGTPADLARAFCEGIASDGHYVYWTQTGVFRVPRSGGSTTTFATSSRTVDYVLAGPSNIYWDTQTSPPVVESKPITGGNAYVVTTLGDGGTDELGFDSGQVCWADHAAGIIACYDITSGQTTTVASGQGHPNDVTAHGGYVYWTEQGGAVSRAPIAGGGPVDVLTTGLSYPSELVVGKYVYVVTRAARTTAVGQVVRVPLTGGTPQVIGANQSSPWSIAVDAKYVYWTDKGGPNTPDGLIMKEAQ